MTLARIRNFSIVAHIDHGKSTLADRLLALTGTMDAKKAVDQVLDSMDLERERGITIKAHTVRLLYKAKDGHEYTLNLIDTPGHVDFSYEVSRALAACEGAILIVDAAQGIEAQTPANDYLAAAAGLPIIPVINKIDLPAADVDGTREQIHDTLDLDGTEALTISAKHGTGVPEVLEAIVTRIPPPTGDPEAPLKALVFDSFYDSYQGVVVYIRLMDGRVRAGMRVLLMSNGKTYEVQQVGVFAPDMRPVEELSAGQVGFLTASIKRVADAKMGETITDVLRPTAEACPGYRDAKPMVFAGLYPIEDTDYEGLRDALEKLRLNDSAFNFEPETSLALGYGFRCGFLGMLHLEIVQERLEREFSLSLIVTAPSVRFRVVTTEGETIDVENPSKLPPVDKIERIEEPYVRGSVFVPTEFMSAIYKLAQDKRGEHKSLECLGKRCHIQFDFPLSEIVVDFYDKLKSISKGYASFDYDFLEFRESEMVKLDILLNGDPVDALSVIVHREKAYEKGKTLTEKLRGVIPRQLYEVAIERKSRVREYEEAIFIAVLLALVIRQCGVQAFTIPSGSMMDTLLVGDYILVNKFLYGAELPLTDAHLPGLRKPRRGDIVVFKYPNDESRDFIKRIVAVEGDTVQVQDNRAILNGRLIDQPYVRPGSIPAVPAAHWGYL